MSRTRHYTGMNKQDIFDKCVKIYLLLYPQWVASLKKDKRYRHAKKFAEITVKDLEGIYAVDTIMRNTFVYSKRHPEATSPWGYGGLLGMVLAIRHMEWDLEGYKFGGGTFLGEFAEFCHSEYSFSKELQELMIWDTGNIAARVFHEIS